MYGVQKFSKIRIKVYAKYILHIVKATDWDQGFPNYDWSKPRFLFQCMSGQLDYYFVIKIYFKF